MIKIYDTMSRDLREFVPIEEGKVRMYVCGPTVYNYIHVGNARSTVAFDTIRRYFEYRGYEVAYISNFTDVDDKIINRAKEEGITPQEVADKYIAAFREDVTALGVKPATRHPRVVEFMDDIIRFVADLIEKGYAYESQGDVYFRVEKSHNYAKLANKTLEDLELGASGRTDEETARKENPVDFALWKAAKPGEISWDSPWGPGRPGWHIECSVMSTGILGDTIDIHGGGADLEFPHHTNEIAQSEAKTGKTFFNQVFHKADDISHKLHHTRMASRSFDTQGRHILTKGSNVLVSHFLRSDPFFLGTVYNFIIYICKIGNIGNLVPTVLKITTNGIKSHRRTGIPHVDIVVDRRPTDIHLNLAVLNRDKFSQITRHGVVNFNHAVHSLLYF